MRNKLFQAQFFLFKHRNFIARVLIVGFWLAVSVADATYGASKFAETVRKIADLLLYPLFIILFPVGTWLISVGVMGIKDKEDPRKFAEAKWKLIAGVLCFAAPILVWAISEYFGVGVSGNFPQFEQFGGEGAEQELQAP